MCPIIEDELPPVPIETCGQEEEEEDKIKIGKKGESVSQGPYTCCVLFTLAPPPTPHHRGLNEACNSK